MFKGTAIALGLLSLGLRGAMAGNAPTDAPDYCVPIDEADQYNPYSWDDMSSDCKAMGIADNCCVTYVQGPIVCEHDIDITAQMVVDLDNGLQEQITKDGQFETTGKGVWSIGFPLGWSAIHDRDVGWPWKNSLYQWFADDGFTPSTVYFQAKKDDYTDQVLATYNC